MTKKDFVELYARKTGETKKKAGELVESFLSAIEETLEKGESIHFVGWGSFEVKETKERIGRNPKSGEAITIPAKKAVRFKVGKKLSEKVN